MPWKVVRQDVHGSRFDVATVATKQDADDLAGRYESGYPHHQTYFVEEVEDAVPPAG